jgi:hypothetical protein
MRIALVAIALYALPAATHAQIMKCIGPGGRVEFASTCPPGTKAENTGIRNAPSAAPSSPQKSLTERDADFRKRQTEQQEAAKKAEEKKQEDIDRRQNCEAAQSYLRSLQSGNRIGKLDPKTGERVFLEDSEREAETARAQRAVDTNCK